ncbi:MAG: DUF5752 family protein [Armatimonadota bacterium]|nr:DUF5752 family protein [Armatimonadota bacterium]
MPRAKRPFWFVTVHELKEMLGAPRGTSASSCGESKRFRWSPSSTTRTATSPGAGTWRPPTPTTSPPGPPSRSGIGSWASSWPWWTPLDYPDLEAVRAEFITILDRHLGSLQTVPRVVYGEPFHFMRSTVLEVPTGVEARDLREFRSALADVDLGALYCHFLYAVTHRRSEADPLRWVEEELGCPELASAIRRTSPYFKSLEGLRVELVSLCDRYAGV